MNSDKTTDTTIQTDATVTISVGIIDLTMINDKKYWSLTCIVQNGSCNSTFVVNNADDVSESKWNSFLSSDMTLDLKGDEPMGVNMRKSSKNGVEIVSLCINADDVGASCAIEAPWAPFAEALRGALEEVRLNPELTFAPEPVARAKTKKSSDVRLGGGGIL